MRLQYRGVGKLATPRPRTLRGFEESAGFIRQILLADHLVNHLPDGRAVEHRRHPPSLPPVHHLEMPSAAPTGHVGLRSVSNGTSRRVTAGDNQVWGTNEPHDKFVEGNRRRRSRAGSAMQIHRADHGTLCWSGRETRTQYSRRRCPRIVSIRARPRGRAPMRSRDTEEQLCAAVYGCRRRYAAACERRRDIHAGTRVPRQSPRGPAKPWDGRCCPRGRRDDGIGDRSNCLGRVF